MDKNHRENKMWHARCCFGVTYILMDVPPSTIFYVTVSRPLIKKKYLPADLRQISFMFVITHSLPIYTSQFQLNYYNRYYCTHPYELWIHWVYRGHSNFPIAPFAPRGGNVWMHVLILTGISSASHHKPEIALAMSVPDKVTRQLHLYRILNGPYIRLYSPCCTCLIALYFTYLCLAHLRIYASKVQSRPARIKPTTKIHCWDVPLSAWIIFAQVRYWNILPFVPPRLMRDKCEKTIRSAIVGCATGSLTISYGPLKMII